MLIRPRRGAPQVDRNVNRKAIRETGRLNCQAEPAPSKNLRSQGRRGRSSRPACRRRRLSRSEEHTSELQALMRTSNAAFSFKKIALNVRDREAYKPSYLNLNYCSQYTSK